MNIEMFCGEVFVCRMLRGTFELSKEKSDGHQSHQTAQANKNQKFEIFSKCSENSKNL
jgi:hypothetical protein